MEMQVVCVGGLLVEVMRQKINEPLGARGTFVGPFPSGAAGIFVDAVAKLGIKSGLVGTVGKDDFGELIISRLEKDGVNISQIKMLDNYTTGVAFVTYFSNGNRRFIYHLSRAATVQIHPEDIKEDFLCNLKYLHLAGSIMFVNDHCRAACQKAVNIVKNLGGKVSFDPNFCPELFASIEEVKSFYDLFVSWSDIVLPTSEEVMMLTGRTNLKEACRDILKRGPEVVVVKQGKEGSTVFMPDKEFHVSPFEVEEVDPTGAGDCYCAGLVVGMLKGMGLREAARFASAVGALATAKKGPMEGAPTLDEVNQLIDSSIC